MLTKFCGCMVKNMQTAGITCELSAYKQFRRNLLNETKYVYCQSNNMSLPEATCVLINNDLVLPKIFCGK